MKGEFISLKTAKILSDNEAEKIQEKNEMILDMWDKEGLAEGWVEAHLRYKELQQRIDKAMKMLTRNKELAKEVENGYAEEICDKGINILEGKDE